jgi:hypothetical protein
MSRTKRFGVIALSALLSVGAFLGFGGVAASAATSTPAAAASCAADVVIGVSGRYVFLWDRVTWYHDGPGGRVTGEVHTQRQVSATLSYGADISINELIAESKVTISRSVTKSVTTTTGHTYYHDIPAKKYGNLQYGAWGYAVSWVKEYRHSNCKITVLGRGTGTVPTVAVGWHYFTTNT